MPSDPARASRSWSVRTRIVASILAVAAAGLAAAGLTTYLTQREQILAHIDDRLVDHAEAARVTLLGGTGTSVDGGPVAVDSASSAATTAAALEAVLRRIVPTAAESSLGVLDGAARFVPGVEVDYRIDGDPAFLQRVVGEVDDGTTRLGTATVDGRLLRYIAVPIQVQGDPQRGVYVATADLGAELADFDAAFRTYAVVALAALGAIALVGWFVAGRLLAPVRSLREAASRITASELAERIPVRGRDDVSALTTTVNDMLDRLEGSMTAQRQLLDDVRHELKTPLTIVRGHLELLRTDDPAEVAATRDLVVDELDRMATLVEDIDLLATLRPAAIATTTVDAAVLTDEVFQKASVIPGRDWQLAGRADAAVELDPDRITQAWLQLVDNASKYSPPGSRVRLGSSRRGDAVVFWVEDEGPGIPAGMEERIFERFGRVDQGRGDGSGLGLAIVRTIARSHGGDVELSTSSAGSRFGIVVPLRERSA